MKIFYGWWIVVSGLIISAFTSGICQYGFTAFIEPIHSDFGWTYTEISVAASIRGLETGLLSPIAGIIVDRIGPRRLMLFGSFALGLGLILLGNVSSLLMFYAVFAIMVIGFSVCVGTVPMTAVANWFQKKVSIAIGIMSCGIGLGGLLVNLIVRLIELYNWRVTAVILGISVILVASPLSLLIRHKPEKYGYRTDGDFNNASTNDTVPVAALPIEVNISTQKALQTSTFWHITVAMMCHGIVVSGLITHVMPYLNSIGLSMHMSGLIASSLPMISIIGRLGSGWLGDRINKKWVSAANFAAMSLGLLFFSFASVENMWVLMSFVILFGIGFGGNFSLCGALTREYFGRSNFGKINGTMYGIMAFGSMAGPLSAGYVFDSIGNYAPIWLLFATISLTALWGIATTPEFGSCCKVR